MVRYAFVALGLVLSVLAAPPSNAYEALVLPSPPDPAAFRPIDMKAVELGRLLFFDRILSGNKQVACATCHHPDFGTSDGVSLSIGDGGIGLGTERVPEEDANRPEQRIGRSSPALFNLGFSEFTTLFHDGRLEADPNRPSGIRTPLEEDMVKGFDSVLSAQAMFPVLSGDEMAGHYSENDVSRAVRQGLLTDPGGAWDIIASRVAGIPAYGDRFRRTYETVDGPADIDFTDIANALAAFVAFEFRADDSPFDRYLRGEGALLPDALAGMELFYGRAGCGSCHSGPFQTDHSFHAIAMPQLGPGKAARFETHSKDVGRMRVTGDLDDAYRFRTPSLRNVALTAPYGHAGAYRSLEAVVRHHLDPVGSLKAYDRGQAVLPAFSGANDWTMMDDEREVAAIAAANQLEPMVLSDAEVSQLIAFLESLTDPVSAKGRLGVPESVPSGLPVD